MRTGRHLVIGVAGAGVLLVALYLILGGGRYTPVAIANPCDPRPWRDPGGVQALVEQVALSALDGAACDLGMSREELALAIGDDGELAALARSKGIDDARLEAILRSGLRRAVVDAQRAEVLTPLAALVIGQAIDQMDVARLLEIYRSGDLDWVRMLLG